MARWEKAALGALLFAATCYGCAHPKPAQLHPYRIPGFEITPPAIYLTWIAQAHNCAFRLRAVLGDSAQFTVDADAIDLSKITWIAVPTERRDRSFVGEISPKGDSLRVAGLTSARADTIWIAAPLLEVGEVVKHEAMHVFVHSVSEFNYGPHGLPWGFCEWL